MKPWKLHQLKSKMIEDLATCQTKNETLNCRAICEKEIRELATDIQKTRKLTPGEVAILEECS